MKSYLLPILSCLMLLFTLGCQSQNSTTVIQDLGKSYDFPTEKHVKGLYHHIEIDDDVNGGNTSLRNVGADDLKWKGSKSNNGYGYFQRNRDLGQVFTVPDNEDVIVDALVLRSSRGSNAIMEGTPNSELYVALFEVSKSEIDFRINENGTSKGDRATHGFDHQFNRADDFIVGDSYKFLKMYGGAVFPETPTTNQYVYDTGKGAPFGVQEGHLRYFRFDFPEDTEMRFEKGKTYAFLVGFAEPAINRGIALAISTEVHTKEPATFITDELGNIRWGIRREGDGTLPPTMIGAPEPPSKKELRERLLRESLFPENHYTTLMPTTNGYPDVDTYRTLQFYLEVRPSKE